MKHVHPVKPVKDVVRDGLRGRFDNVCWRCGNRGFWYEQIDGLDNRRVVWCDCIHSRRGESNPEDR